MTKFALIDTNTNEVIREEDFFVEEEYPKDLPHKNLIWRQIKIVRQIYDPLTQYEDKPKKKITKSHLIIEYKIKNKSPKRIKKEQRNKIQNNLFHDDTDHLGKYLLYLTNEIRLLKAESMLTKEEFVEYILNVTNK